MSKVRKFSLTRQVWIDEEGRSTCNDYDIAFVIPDGSNFQTAVLPEARVMRFYIDEVGEKVPARCVSLSTAETVLLLLKLSLVNPRTSRSSDRAGGVEGT